MNNCSCLQKVVKEEKLLQIKIKEKYQSAGDRTLKGSSLFYIEFTVEKKKNQTKEREDVL